MKPLSVKELYDELAIIISKGGGDRKILITSDDEGNEYHYMWYLPEMCNKNCYDITPYCHESITYEELVRDHIIIG